MFLFMESINLLLWLYEYNVGSILGKHLNSRPYATARRMFWKYPPTYILYVIIYQRPHTLKKPSSICNTITNSSVYWSWEHCLRIQKVAYKLIVKPTYIHYIHACTYRQTCGIQAPILRRRHLTYTHQPLEAQYTQLQNVVARSSWLVWPQSYWLDQYIRRQVFGVNSRERVGIIV